LEAAELKELATLGSITVKKFLNPKSTGFRELGLDLKAIDDGEAARLINKYPNIMRRPLLSDGHSIAVGFIPDQFAALTG
jgi:arsenate reductase-like glutaredoxin family protein